MCSTPPPPTSNDSKSGGSLAFFGAGPGLGRRFGSWLRRRARLKGSLLSRRTLPPVPATPPHQQEEPRPNRPRLDEDEEEDEVLARLSLEMYEGSSEGGQSRPFDVAKSLQTVKEVSPYKVPDHLAPYYYCLFCFSAAGTGAPSWATWRSACCRRSRTGPSWCGTAATTTTSSPSASSSTGQSDTLE